MSFTFKHQNFEGPLDKLLELIEEHKLHINDLALSKVTDEYLSWSKNLPELPMAEAAQFILVASTLLLIKSKSLLPSLALSEEEEEDIRDLEERLRVYQRIKTLMPFVRSRFGQSPIFLNTRRVREPVFHPDSSITSGNLLSSLHAVISAMPIKEFLPETIVKKIISLEEMMSKLSERVSRTLSASFRDFTKGSGDKREVIVGFLALLELVKRGALMVAQDSRFADIRMESAKPNTPSYV